MITKENIAGNSLQYVVTKTTRTKLAPCVHLHSDRLVGVPHRGVQPNAIRGEMACDVKN